MKNEHSFLLLLTIDFSNFALPAPLLRTPQYSWDVNTLLRTSGGSLIFEGIEGVPPRSNCEDGMRELL
jgi:hypothetical protein